MRHLGSLVLALVLAPAIWALSGYGMSDAKEFDAIRAEFIEKRGESDAKYIRKVIDTQRKFDVGSAPCCCSRCSRPRGSSVRRA